MPASLLTVTPLTASGISHVFDNIPYGASLWLDATKIGGISSGASLSVWTDLSGTASHATQTSATSQPVFLTNAINGLSAVSFLGGTKATWLKSVQTNIRSLFFVASWNTVGGGNNREPVADTAGNFAAVVLGADSKINAYAGAALAGAVVSVGSAKAVGAIFNGSASTLNYNGSITTGNAGTNIPQVGVGIGATFDGLATMNGVIGEVIGYRTVLSNADTVTIMSYLTSKWGT